MENSDTNSLLREILASLRRIERHLAEQSDQTPLEEVSEKHPPPMDVVELINNLSLNHEQLIPTIKALLSSQNGGSAQDIAEITKRSRSRENQHLNRLVELGYVQKKREGREIRFYLT
jgi:predicted transcriptional regulator